MKYLSDFVFFIISTTSSLDKFLSLIDIISLVIKSISSFGDDGRYPIESSCSVVSVEDEYYKFKKEYLTIQKNKLQTQTTPEAYKKALSEKKFIKFF